MKINNFRGELTDISAKKEALAMALLYTLTFLNARAYAFLNDVHTPSTIFVLVDV